MSRGHHNNVGPVPFLSSVIYPPSIYFFRAGYESQKYFHYGDEEDIYGDTDGGGGGPVVDTGVANLQLDHQSSPLYESPNPRKTVILVNDIPYSTYRALIYYVSLFYLNLIFSP